ncbi:MAG: tRNA adenosine deaminase-associated protein [Alphaproteobacteria bacterium]
MGYFAVVLTRQEDGWDTNDIELDEIDSLSDLADAMRDIAEDADSDGPALLLLEQEDLWFAIVRVDSDDDPRVFVSDRSAIEHSAYAEMLLEAALGDDEAELDDLDSGEDSEDSKEDEDEDDDREAEAEDGPVGDFEILLDLGTNPDALLDLCSSEGVLPSEALTVLAERAGAVGALEAVR